MSSKNIFFAFILNLIFVIIEIVGGFLTNSIAILSDSIHDAGDCFAIGIAYFLERKSNKKTNENYTYGYKRFSVMSALISSCILLVGGTLCIYNSILRIINPTDINGLGMFIIAIFGVVINGLAVLKTAKSKNLNERVINLHMLEDVLSWIVVLIGSIFVWIFNLLILDAILSICVSVYVLIHAMIHLVEAFSIFLEKKPKNFKTKEFSFELEQIENIKSIHHMHIWTLDGESLIATVHIVTSENEIEKICKIKNDVKNIASKYNINHITTQIDFCGENCLDCELNETQISHHHHKHCHNNHHHCHHNH